MIKFYNKKNIYNFFLPHQYKNVFFSVYSINMPNISQNNVIEHINKKITLLQDRLKINEKSQNQFKNSLM